MNIITKHQNRGFTLVETLIAIAILLISIAGPLSIIAQSLKASYQTRDEIVAQYLAQEAIEYVRNLRDVSGLKTVKSGVNSYRWLDSIQTGYQERVKPWSSINQFNNYYYIQLVRDSNKYSLRFCLFNDLNCGKVRYDPNGVYAYGDTLAPEYSKFTRVITFFETAPVDNVIEPAYREINVTVKVSWNVGLVNKSIFIRENLSNWQLENLPF